MDEPGAASGAGHSRGEQGRHAAGGRGGALLVTSAVTGQGIDELVAAVVARATGGSLDRMAARW